MKNVIVSVFLITFSQFTFSTEENDLTFQKETEENRLALPDGYDEFSEVISEERFKKAVKFYFSNVTDVYNIVFSQGFYYPEIPFVTDLFSISFTAETSNGDNKNIECVFRTRSSKLFYFTRGIVYRQPELKTYRCKSDGVVIPVRMIIPASYQL